MAVPLIQGRGGLIFPRVHRWFLCDVYPPKDTAMKDHDPRLASSRSSRILLMLSGLTFIGLFVVMLGSGKKIGFSTGGNIGKEERMEKSAGQGNALGIVFREQGVAAAVAMLDGEKDDSVRRKLLKNFLREIARGEKNPESIAKVFHLLHSTSHRWDPFEFRDERGLELVMRLQPDEILAILEHTTLNEIPQGFLHGLGAKILHHPETARPVLASFVGMGGKKETILMESAEAARDSGYSALEFDRFSEPHVGGVERQVFGSFLSGYLNYNPDKLMAAIAEAEQLSSSVFQKMLSGYAILRMGRDNPVLAHDLFQARRGWFDVEEHDNILSSLIDDVFHFDDRGQARVWVDEILDPERRRYLRKQIEDPKQRYLHIP